MAGVITRPRGDRNASWLVIQRGLALVRRLMRGPATKEELLLAVRMAVGPDSYSQSASAATHALKNDRAALDAHLGIRIEFDRPLGCYRLASLGDLPWLDLAEDALAAIATIYTAFTDGGPEAERVRAFLDTIAGMLPPERSWSKRLCHRRSPGPPICRSQAMPILTAGCAPNAEALGCGNANGEGVVRFNSYSRHQ